jgi:hypothetical protein
MQNIDLPYGPGRRRNVYSDNIVVLREAFKERPAHLSKSDDNDIVFLSHCLASFEKRSSS